MPGTPRPILMLTLLASLFCVITALGGIVLASIGQRWYMLAFEVCVLVTSVCGVLLGLGKLRAGPAMSIVCVGGVTLVGSILAEPAIVARVVQGSTSVIPPIAGVNIVPWVYARVLIGLGLVALAGLTVLLRKPRVSLPLLVKGVLLGLPVAASGAFVVVPGLRSMVLSLPTLGQIILAIVGFFVIGALVSLSGHCLIRAFEVGAMMDESEEPKPAAAEPARPVRVEASVPQPAAKKVVATSGAGSGV